MMDVLQSIFAFIITLGVLITFHEFGHYWVARRCDVKILRFSIGFGRALYTKHFGRDNTAFVIAALPLGGYVKMLDDREGDVKAEDLPRSFNFKPLWQRVAIVLAGPAFNFIFAVFAYWIIFVVGISGLKPIIGEVEPSSISANAGLQFGQEILSINDTPARTWSTVIDMLIKHVVNREIINLTVMNSDGSKQTITIDLSKISIDAMAEGKLLKALGLSVFELKVPAVVGEILAGGVAAKSGLLPHDEIISVNGVAIDSWGQWVDIIRNSPGQGLNVIVSRGVAEFNVSVTPDSVESEGSTIGRIGVVASIPEGLFDAYFVRESHSLPSAFASAIQKTWDMSVLTLRVLGRMLIGEASVKNLSGPISIAKYAGQSAGIGALAFLSFMAIVSVSLGVFNLLPVPLLDGGHLLYYFIEIVIGRPVSENMQLIGQQAGIVLLWVLMSIVFYNDIVRLLG